MFVFVFCFRLNIFTTKPSSLLLSLGVERPEGAGDCESYPTSEIPNIYIYDAFLMIYLPILLMLLFYFLVLQRSESEIHKGCNSVTL